MDEDKDKRKPHRPKTSGRKAEKKAKKNEDTKAVSQAGMTKKQRNPKAFAIQNVTRLKKRVRRTLDIKEKKVHDPVVDRTPLEPPPIIVAIVGPPKVGKSTLMKGLIKNYTSQKLSTIQGPVTIVSGKKRRLTFIECNNDMNSMIDIAKVADLVLLLIDASFGMEMETFEFLNICQVHGFPRIMGVLTHLDYFKDNKKLKTVRKTLKHRFWTEIYQGAKLFYLSGMIHGEFLKNEVHNLARFISVMKFRPLTWRNCHPYVLADRMEDITDTEKLRLNPKASRNVSFYGWMRGVPLKNKSTIHIPGCGDFIVSDVSHLPDPCPLPDLNKRRSLNDLERKIYAPLSGVGGIVYDKDAVYIDLGNNTKPQKQNDEEYEMDEERGEDMKAAMIGTQKTLAEKMTESSLSIFANSEAITSDQFAKENKVVTPSYETVEESGRTRRRAVFSKDIPEESSLQSDEESDNEEGSDIDHDRILPQSYSFRQPLHEKDEDSSSDADADEEIEQTDGNDNEESSTVGHLKWKDNLVAKASQAFLERQRTTPNLRKLVYEIDTQKQQTVETNSADEVGGMFKVISRSERNAIDNNDCTRMLIKSARDWSTDEVKALIVDCFVTGEWEASKDAQKLLDEDDDMYGDFEDLEHEELSGSEEEGGDDEAGEADESGEEKATKELPLDGNNQKSKKLTKEDRQKKIEEKRLAKKQRVKEMFNAEYDKATNGDGTENRFDSRKAELEIQSKLNRSEFDGVADDMRILYEGYRAGLYVRIEIQDMPCEFVTNFDPTVPIIVGGMTNTESVIGCLQARFKKHRWYNKILKTKDPIICSLGWRRFQTIPLYTIQDHNGRNRHLKYTPEHMHCNAIFWGPSTPQNTGLLCLQSYSSEHKGFRVCATGVILSIDKSMSVMKKLKLIGYPHQVKRNTAFIKDMFTSQLEVAKFEGAKIKTVSGIRGQVKKALRSPEGAFRATFEDTILMSDIVFLKTWYQVEIPKFYNPVTNLLMPSESRAEWKGMKTLGMLRKENATKAPFTADSQYQKDPIRKKHHLKPFEIPRRLQKDLPFDFKPKVRGRWEDPLLSKRVAVIRDTHEKKRDQLLNQLRTIHTVKEIKTREDKQQRHRDYRKKKGAEEAEKNKRRQKVRKELYTKLGKIKERVHKKINFHEATE